MARKRDSTPQKQPEEEEVIVEVPEEEPPVVEEIQEPAPAESMEDLIEGILGPQPKVEISAIVLQDGKSTAIEENYPGGVDDYIRSQVLKEMYGTDNPSEYDKIQLALKRLL
jgi:hypothetical protein